MKRIDVILSYLRNRYVSDIAGIEVATGIPRRKLYKLLYYLKSRGRVVELWRGFYAVPEAAADPLVLATAIHQPSYISFGTALYVLGTCSEYAFRL